MKNNKKIALVLTGLMFGAVQASDFTETVETIELDTTITNSLDLDFSAQSTDISDIDGMDLVQNSSDSSVISGLFETAGSFEDSATDTISQGFLDTLKAKWNNLSRNQQYAVGAAGATVAVAATYAGYKYFAGKKKPVSVSNIPTLEELEKRTYGILASDATNAAKAIAHKEFLQLAFDYGYDVSKSTEIADAVYMITSKYSYSA